MERYRLITQKKVTLMSMFVGAGVTEICVRCGIRPCSICSRSQIVLLMMLFLY